MRRRRASLLLALAWMALLFYLSHQPGVPTPQLFAHQDKLLHALAYGVLAALLLHSMTPVDGEYSGGQIARAALLAGLYGISDEIHQHFVPQRHADVFDWLADAAGALLAALLVARFSRHGRIRQKKPVPDRNGF